MKDTNRPAYVAEALFRAKVYTGSDDDFQEWLSTEEFCRDYVFTTEDEDLIERAWRRRPSAQQRGHTDMNIREKDRRILTDLDCEAFIADCVEQGVPAPCEETALAAMHKARCVLAADGRFDETLGAESGRWLNDRGMWPGVRWWVL